ncbi:hypothetical protein [Deinococcus aestuarii]|uniref:hypothetical protein n=1 Tax=Deinococcus aestuarii TaxID=2774531 RepID=UPI001C0AB63A|nr:hypothetical protein [Deinococcus aestuarii]
MNTRLWLTVCGLTWLGSPAVAQTESFAIRARCPAVQETRVASPEAGVSRFRRTGTPTLVFTVNSRVREFTVQAERPGGLQLVGASRLVSVYRLDDLFLGQAVTPVPGGQDFLSYSFTLSPGRAGFTAVNGVGTVLYRGSCRYDWGYA